MDSIPLPVKSKLLPSEWWIDASAARRQGGGREGLQSAVGGASIFDIRPSIFDLRPGTFDLPPEYLAFRRTAGRGRGLCYTSGPSARQVGFAPAAIHNEESA
jgi:hypothetical protein